jgi:hypothetical protein
MIFSLVHAQEKYGSYMNSGISGGFPGDEYQQAINRGARPPPGIGGNIGVSRGYSGSMGGVAPGMMGARRDAPAAGGGPGTVSGVTVSFHGHQLGVLFLVHHSRRNLP